MGTPLDVALEATVKLADERKQEDLHVWHQWKKNPTPENMDVLMGRFEPMFRQRAQLWKAPNVNQAAFVTNLRINAVHAFDTFDPTHKPKFGDQSAALRTWVDQKLQRVKRFNTKQQNYAYMPEEQVGHIGRIQQAQDELYDKFGRLPTSPEIVEHVNPNLTGRQRLTEKKVNRILEGQRKDIIGSSFEDDPTPHAVQREREVISLLGQTLSPEQKQVYDHLYGQDGKSVITSTTQLAARLGKSPSQISRLRTGILAKFDEYNK